MMVYYLYYLIIFILIVLLAYKLINNYINLIDFPGQPKLTLEVIYNSYINDEADLYGYKINIYKRVIKEGEGDKEKNYNEYIIIGHTIKDICLLTTNNIIEYILNFYNENNFVIYGMSRIIIKDTINVIREDYNNVEKMENFISEILAILQKPNNNNTNLLLKKKICLADIEKVIEPRMIEWECKIEGIRQ